jgi:hypothetical protein
VGDFTEGSLMPGFWCASNDLFDEHAPHLSAGAVGLYCYLCRKANSEGVSWPSLPTIAETLRLSPNTVRRYLAQLSGRGLIEIMPRQGHKGGYSYRVAAHVSGGRAPAAVQNLNPSEEKGATIEPQRVQPLNPAGENGSKSEPQTVQNLNPNDGEAGPGRVQNLREKGSNFEPKGYPLKDTHVPPSGVLPPLRSEERTSRSDEKTQPPATEPPKPAPEPPRPPRARPPKPPAPESTAAPPDYTTVAARGLACRNCRAHYLAEFRRCRPAGKPPVATGADAGILKNALAALHDADGGDWLEAETELKRLLTLFFADEYAARNGWALKLLPGMLNALRGLGETHGTSRERDGRRAGNGAEGRPGQRGTDREARMDARLIALADQWPDDPHVLAAIQRQRQRDGCGALA